MKITKVLGDDKYEVKIDKFDTNKHPVNFGVCRDYVLFSSWTHLYTDDNTRIPTGRGGSTNILPVPTSLQINCKMMGEIILPNLIASQYLQPDVYSTCSVWSDSPVSNWSDSKNVHIYDKGQKKFIEISRELYKQLNP